MGFGKLRNHKVKAKISLIGFTRNKMLDIQNRATKKNILTCVTAEYELKKKSSTVVSVHHFPSGDEKITNEATLDKSIDKGFEWILNH